MHRIRDPPCMMSQKCFVLLTPPYCTQLEPICSIWDNTLRLIVNVVYECSIRKKEALDCLDGPLKKLPSSFLIDGPHKNPMHSKVLIP